MAEPIVKKFVIDTAESEQNLKELNTQIAITSNSIEDGAQSFKDVATAQEEVVESGKGLKAQLREIQLALQEAEPDSAAYVELAQAASEIKDKIGDAAEAVSTQAGGAFERVSNSLGLVTGRLTSLDFSGAAEGANLLAQNIKDISIKDITEGVKGVKDSFVSVGKALLANPLFLVGAAIASAVIYADQLKTLIDGVTDAELERLEAQKQSAAYSKEQLDAIGQQENILKLQGKTEREILNIKIAAAEQALIDQRIVLETQKAQRQGQIDAAKRNKEILEGIIKFVSAPLAVVLKGVDLITAGLNKIGVISDETFATFGSLSDKLTTSVAELVFDPEAIAKESDNAIKESEKTLQNLENQQAGFKLAIQEMDKKAASDRKDANDKQLEDAKKLAEEQAKLVQDYYDKLAALEDEQFKNSLSKNEQEKLELIQKYEEIFAAANAAKKDTSSLQSKLNGELLKLQEDQILKESNLRNKSNEELLINQKSFLAENIKNDIERLNAQRAVIEEEQKIRLARLQQEINLAQVGSEERINAEIEYNTTKQELEQSLITNSIALKEAENARLLELSQLSLDNELGINANRIEALNLEYAERERLYANDAEMLEAIEKEKQRRIIAIEQETKDAKLGLASEALGSIANLANAFANGDEKRAKKAFKIQKAISIAQATVDTYKGANAIFANAAANPATVLFPAQPFIAAGIAIASGLANVATIAQQEFQGGTTPGGNETVPNLPGDNNGGSQPAQFNPLAASFLDQRQEQITPRAYVLAGDVASAAEVRENVADLARIG